MHSIEDKILKLLRYGESLLKLDLVYIIKGSLWTTLSFLVGTSASIISMIAFGNLLSRETYGIYSYLLSLGASLSFLTFSGTGIAVMRAVARGYENVVPSALRLQLKYNLFAVATILSATIYYGYKGNMLFATSLAMLSLAYPLSEAYHIYVNVLTGRKRFDTLTKITSVVTVVSTLATVITLLLTKNVFILIVVYALMSLLPSIIAYLIATKNIKKKTPDPEQINELRRTSFHITGAGLVGTLAQYIDRIVLFQVAGPATLAVYGFAIAGPERLKSLIKNWGTITQPRLAEKSIAQLRQVVYKRIGFSLLIGLSLSLVYMFLAPLFFKLFLPHYLDSIFYSQVQALGLIVAPVIIFIGTIFASQNMLRATYVLSVGTQVIRIFLFVTFGWLWQIWGLVAASLLSTLLNAIYGILIWEVETRRIMTKND